MSIQLHNILKAFLYFMCINVLPACMYVYRVHASCSQRSKEGVESCGSRAKDGCEPYVGAGSWI